MDAFGVLPGLRKSGAGREVPALTHSASDIEDQHVRTALASCIPPELLQANYSGKRDAKLIDFMLQVTEFGNFPEDADAAAQLAMVKTGWTFLQTVVLPCCESN